MTFEDIAFEYRNIMIGKVVLDHCKGKSAQQLQNELYSNASHLPDEAAEIMIPWVEETLNLASTPGYWRRDAGHVVFDICTSAKKRLDEFGINDIGDDVIYFFNSTICSWGIILLNDQDIRKWVNEEIGNNHVLSKLSNLKDISTNVINVKIVSIWTFLVLLGVGVVLIVNNMSKSNDYIIAECSCAGNLYNCDSFPSLEHAQLCYEYCMKVIREDVHLLDMDNDGRACEPY